MSHWLLALALIESIALSVITVVVLATVRSLRFWLWTEPDIRPCPPAPAADSRLGETS